MTECVRQVVAVLVGLMVQVLRIVSATAELGRGNCAVMVLYFAFVVGLGVFFSRREKNTDEYLLGGRRMPWFVIGISYMISLLSTISLVAVPGEAFNHGLTMAFRNLISPFASVLAFYLFVRFYFRVRTYTPFSYLEQRYDRRVRLLGSLVFWWTRLAYLALVLYSSSKVFEGAAGYPVWFTILVVGLVGVVYTTLGGMKAVVWTDFAQFLILAVGLGLVTLKCAASVEGGFAGIVTYAFEHERGFEGFKDPAFFAVNPYVRLSFWLLFIGIFTEHLFYSSSDQISIQRLLSTSSYERAENSLYTFAVVGVPFMFVLWFLGLAIFAFYSQHPDPSVTSGDIALFRFIGTHLPSPVPGLVISAMLAAVMSTLDSGMNSLAAVATKDLYIVYFCPDATEEEQVTFSRLMTVLVGVSAIVVALVIATVSTSLKETIIEASAIWMAFNGVLAPAFLVGVTTRKVNAGDIIAAIVTSWCVTAGMIVWYLIGKQGPTPISFMFVGFPGFVVMLVMGYAPLLMRRRAQPDKTDGLTLLTLEPQVPRVPGRVPGGVSKRLYLGAIIGGLLAAFLSTAVWLAVRAMAGADSSARTWLPALGCLAVAAGLGGAAATFALIYRMWAAIQDGRPRTTPAKAVGFLFIPVFNVYWGSQAYWGWARDYNRYIEDAGIDAPRASEGLAFAMFALLLGAAVPILGLLAVYVYLILSIKFWGNVCDGINAIAASKAAAAQ